MDFALPDDLLALQRAVRDFAQREIAPVAVELDREPRFPRATLRKMGEMGLLGILTPEAYGGLGLGYLAYAVLLEEIAAADAAHATIASVTNGMPQSLILTHGSAAQRDRWLPRLAAGDAIGAFCLSEPHAGSDAAALRTRARRVDGGYRLDGSKAWITSGGEADLYLVLAKTDPEAGARGITAFVLERDTPGLSFGAPERKLGQHAAITTSVRFDDAFVPEDQRLGEEGQGFVMAMSALDGGRVGIAAQALGIARAAFAAAARHAEEREAFGRPIREFQGVGFKLADMATRIEAARLLTHRAAWLLDRGTQATKEVSMAKLAASEAAVFVCDAAVQVFGGYGYSADYPVERYLRDARVTTLYEGTSEIQRVVIARQIHRETAR
ncbi:MAG: acyl-CoA dehydrogenase family protein [Trueperaceae bacterium]|nr:acyl-CoA dehydrogenase family protein [Trueperaceae bacterium]